MAALTQGPDAFFSLNNISGGLASSLFLDGGSLRRGIIFSSFSSGSLLLYHL